MAKKPSRNGTQGATSFGVNDIVTIDGTPKGRKSIAATSKKKRDGELIVARRHPAWLEHQIGWRQLMDSYEGGMRYRNAVYGPDRKGLPVRNLFRHRREYPDPGQFPAIYQGFPSFLGAASARTQSAGWGSFPGMIGADPGATAQDDDYELRRSRTPIPEFVAEALNMHLGKIWSRRTQGVVEGHRQSGNSNR